MSFTESISNAAHTVGNTIISAFNTTRQVYIPALINKVAGAHQYVKQNPALNTVAQLIAYLAGPIATFVGDHTVNGFATDPAQKQFITRVITVIGFAATALAVGSLASSWPMAITLTAVSFVAFSVLFRLLTPSSSSNVENVTLLKDLGATQIAHKKLIVEAYEKELKAVNENKELKDEERTVKVKDINVKIELFKSQIVDLHGAFGIETEEQKKSNEDKKKLDDAKKVVTQFETTHIVVLDKKDQEAIKKLDGYADYDKAKKLVDDHNKITAEKDAKKIKEDEDKKKLEEDKKIKEEQEAAKKIKEDQEAAKKIKEDQEAVDKKIKEEQEAVKKIKEEQEASELKLKEEEEKKKLEEDKKIKEEQEAAKKIKEEQEASELKLKAIKDYADKKAIADQHIIEIGKFNKENAAALEISKGREEELKKIFGYDLYRIRITEVNEFNKLTDPNAKV